MGATRVVQRAIADLDDIWDFIALDDPARADSFVREIRGGCDLLASSPQIGRARSDLGQGIRFFPKRRYAIFYRALPEGGVEVARVLSNYRDLGAEMFLAVDLE